MKGYIKERGSSYLIGVCLGKDPDNPKKYKYYWETVKTTSKPVAEKRLREVLTEHDKGIFIKPTRKTLGEYLDEWVEDYAKTKPLAPLTSESYKYLIGKYIKPKLGDIPLKSLQPTQVQKFYTSLLNKDLRRTCKYCHAILHKALKMAFKQGIVARNVTDACEVPAAVETDAAFLDESEALKLMKAARQTPYFTMAYLFLTSGTRRAELIALKWSDIDLEEGKISITRAAYQLRYGKGIKKEVLFKEPKSKKSKRIIPLPTSTIQVLKDEYQAQVDTKKALKLLKVIESDNTSRDMTQDEIKASMKDSLVFCHLIDGSPLRLDSVSHAFTRIARNAGLSEAHLHTLRHSYASVMISQGIHLKVVQELMGHSSVQVTGDIYSHLSPGLKEAAVQKLDRFLTNKKVLLPA